ncbi:EF-hand domain-containing protein [Polaromonas sp.]|uniref:EF-hand domain-containing protein n=1 Tax=Polaromonas sp. TaxID=1869339 RepID=UPI003BAACA5D
MTVFATPSSKVKKHSIPNFEMRSVLFMAALVIGSINVSHAQAAAPSPAGQNPSPTQMSPSGTPGSIAPNKASSKDVDAAFARSDTNKDGKLDRKEAENLPAVAQRFDQIDANHDGFISREEFNKAAGA